MVAVPVRRAETSKFSKVKRVSIMANYWDRNSWRCEVAIDLGTAFVRVATKKTAVVTMPTTQSPIPLLRNGVIIDQQAVSDLLRPLLGRARRLGLLRPRVVVGTPTDATDEEREVLATALHQAGAASVGIVSEPFAAAMGAGVNLLSPYAQMIVDVGEGVTDCVIVRAGEVLESQASRIGCCSLRDLVHDDLHRCWGQTFTVTELERMIAAAGTGNARRIDSNIEIRVGSCKADFRKPLSVRPTAFHAIIEPVVVEVLATAVNLLRKVPPALGCEIIESGIVLTGGGALLPGLRERLAEETSIQVTTPAQPLDAVILGLRGMLEQ